MRCLQGRLAYLVSVKMGCKILRLSDVEGLAITYLNEWKSEKSVALMKTLTVFLSVFCLAPKG